MPKISQYPAQTGASVANGDLFPIVDVGSPNVSEYITADELAQIPQLSSRYASSTSFPAGAWTAWTPTITSGTGTITTSTVLGAEYQQYGKLVVCAFSIRIDDKGTAAGVLKITVPVTGESGSGLGNGGWCGGYRETANSGTLGYVARDGGSGVFMAEMDGTTPFNFNGDVFRGTFTYEAA